MKSLIILFSFLTILTGIIYPMAVTFFGGMFFPKQVSGQLIKDKDGQLRGSFLIAQSFTSDQYFHPRPSAINYDAKSSGASQWSMKDKRMVDFIENQKIKGEIFPEKLTQSGSGLDPEISYEDAKRQAARVSESTGIDLNELKSLIGQQILRGNLDSFSEKRINVIKLNFEIFKRLEER